MKKISFGVIVMIAILMGYSAYNAQESNKLSDMTLANVEVLAQNNMEQITGGYNNMHLTCYENVNYNGQIITVPSGKYSATCWPVEHSKKNYHSHYCSSCKSY